MDVFMELFGLSMQDFLFQIFLPFIFFFLLVYALLRKTKIFGEGAQTNRINSLISVTLSALSIFSLYSLGLTTALPILGAITAVLAFVILFLFGTISYSMKKGVSYKTQEAFKTKDEKRFDTGVKTCENLWGKFQKDRDEKVLQEMVNQVKTLDSLAKKLGKTLSEYSWFGEFMEEVGRRQG
jgi:Zn-dependent protease with chaperone function